MTIDAFTYESQMPRVVFGAGRLSEIPQETQRLDMHRVLILTSDSQRRLAERVAAMLGASCAGLFAEAKPHVPVEVVEKACAAARDGQADSCLAVGGGSTIGLGKAVALASNLPTVALPTTYAGSEMTAIWGMTTDRRKQTGRDPAVLARCVIYDPELTLSLPTAVSVTSGFNAVAHAVEALYAPDLSPVIALMAEEGIRFMARALPAIAAEPGSLPVRTDALRGAWMCGASLAATTMGLHHKLCHVLGGAFDLPHAELHTVLLPYVAAFNLPYAPNADYAIRRAVGCDDAPRWLAHTSHNLGAPHSLGDLGLASKDISSVADEVVRSPYANPRTITKESVEQILNDALTGTLNSPKLRPRGALCADK